MATATSSVEFSSTEAFISGRSIPSSMLLTIERVGVIPYVKLLASSSLSKKNFTDEEKRLASFSKIWFAFGIDAKYGELTDCGGRRTSMLEPIERTAARELYEESTTLFDYRKRECDILNSPVITNGKICIFFLRIQIPVAMSKCGFPFSLPHLFVSKGIQIMNKVSSTVNNPRQQQRRTTSSESSSVMKVAASPASLVCIETPSFSSSDYRVFADKCDYDDQLPPPQQKQQRRKTFETFPLSLTLSSNLNRQNKSGRIYKRNNNALNIEYPEYLDFFKKLCPPNDPLYENHGGGGHATTEARDDDDGDVRKEKEEEDVNSNEEMFKSSSSLHLLEDPLFDSYFPKEDELAHRFSFFNSKLPPPPPSAFKDSSVYKRNIHASVTSSKDKRSSSFLTESSSSAREKHEERTAFFENSLMYWIPYDDISKLISLKAVRGSSNYSKGYNMSPVPISSASRPYAKESAIFLPVENPTDYEISQLILKAKQNSVLLPHSSASSRKSSSVLSDIQTPSHILPKKKPYGTMMSNNIIASALSSDDIPLNHPFLYENVRKVLSFRFDNVKEFL
jgi:hypothetical protein